jgi:hypothetical protein
VDELIEKMRVVKLVKNSCILFINVSNRSRRDESRLDATESLWFRVPNIRKEHVKSLCVTTCFCWTVWILNCLSAIQTESTLFKPDKNPRKRTLLCKLLLIYSCVQFTWSTISNTSRPSRQRRPLHYDLMRPAVTLNSTGLEFHITSAGGFCLRI